MERKGISQNLTFQIFVFRVIQVALWKLVMVLGSNIILQIEKHNLYLKII